MAKRTWTEGGHERALHVRRSRLSPLLPRAAKCNTCGRRACDEHDVLVCAGCGEVVTERAENGDSLCCAENVSVEPQDSEPDEPDWDAMRDAQEDR